MSSKRKKERNRLDKAATRSLVRGPSDGEGAPVATRALRLRTSIRPSARSAKIDRPNASSPYTCFVITGAEPTRSATSAESSMGRSAFRSCGSTSARVERAILSSAIPTSAEMRIGSASACRPIFWILAMSRIASAASPSAASRRAARARRRPACRSDSSSPSSMSIDGRVQFRGKMQTSRSAARRSTSSGPRVRASSSVTA